MEWRPPLLLQVLSWILLAIALILAVPCLVFTLAGTWSPSSALPGLAICVGFGVALYVSGIRPKVSLTQEGLVVRNSFRTRFVAWGDIQEVRAGATGVRVQLPSAEVTIKAVAKSNLATAFNRTSRADLFVLEVEKLARARGATIPSLEPEVARELSRRRAVLTRQGLAWTYAVSLAAWLLYLVLHR